MRIQQILLDNSKMQEYLPFESTFHNVKFIFPSLSCISKSTTYRDRNPQNSSLFPSSMNLHAWRIKSLSFGIMLRMSGFTMSTATDISISRPVSSSRMWATRIPAMWRRFAVKPAG
jgi:hypothetical protein